MNTITNIELFAGAGGLALGLEQAGIEGVEFVEFNHRCLPIHCAKTARIGMLLRVMYMK